MSEDMKEKIQEIVSGVQEYPVKSKSFWLPNLEQIASYVEFEMKKNYSKVLVFTFLLRKARRLTVTRWRWWSVRTSHSSAVPPLD